MATRFPVTVRELPEIRIAYIRVLDSFREGAVTSAFGGLSDWAKRMNLFSSERIFGMSVDDPLVTPKGKYSYEACVTLPSAFEMNPEDFIRTTALPKCRYAVLPVSGDFSLVATATNYLFNRWLTNSMYEPEHEPGLEVFLDNEKVSDWSEFDLELYLPLKPLIIT